MNKNVLNLLIETLGLFAFSIVVATGIVLEWVLLPGAGRIEMLGHGRRHQSIDLYLGFTRHEWGELHWWAGAVFLVIMLVHIALHWKWIVAMCWGSKSRPQPAIRRFAICISVLILLAPIFVALSGTKETRTAEEFRRQERQAERAAGSE